MSVDRVFVACPLSGDGTETRMRSDKLMRFVIAPVLKEFVNSPPEQSIIRSDTLAEPGRITTQILRELASADLVIADVTDTNPNVMYEIGIRQAMLKPMVLLAEKDQRLPFDLSDLRTVFYVLDLDHFEQVQTELRQHVTKALSGTLSTVDAAIFGSSPNVGAESVSERAGLLSVLEVCESILNETRDTKSLVTTIGGVLLELREDADRRQEADKKAAEQEMGMFMFQQLLQNPDAADKILPVMQKFAEFGNQNSRRDRSLAKNRKKP